MALSALTPAQILQKIRYDSLTKKGSVLDVVQLVTGCTKDNTSRNFSAVTDVHPEVLQKVTDFKFPGQGQRPTPVAHLNTLIEIAWLCPGRHAKEFRRTGAVTLCRALGGDLSLVDEIRARHAEVDAKEQEALLAGTGVTTAEANGQAIVPAGASAAEQERRYKLENDRLEAEVAKIREETAMNTYRQLRELEAAADEVRDRLYLQDAARNYLRARFPAHSQALSEGQPANDAVTISEVARELGLRLRRGDESRVGRALAQLYRDEHGADPPKHVQFVDGAARKVNSYFTKDRHLVETALRQTLVNCKT